MRSTAAEAQVLCVCTANVCRSPMMELLLTHVLRSRRPEQAGTMTIGSAGVRAHEGLPIAEHAADLLAERGIDASGFGSRPITPDLVERADLVLCAGREHRSAVIALVPGARGTTFTVREFAWLLGQEPVPPSEAELSHRLRQLVDVARDRRGLQQPERPDDLDLDDPYGKRKIAFKRTLALLETTLAGPLELLAPTDAEPLPVERPRRSWWR